MMLALVAAAALQVPASPAIVRLVLASTPTMQAARVEYAPGAAEPPGNHGYEVVLVPVDEGISAEVDGTPAAWVPGVPLLISRGAPHRIENRSNHRVRFIEVRTLGDNAAGNDRAMSARGATIVRSAFDPYLRATVWRFEPGAVVRWVPEVDAIVVDSRAPGRALASREWKETEKEIDVVRVSRMAGSR